MENAHSNSGLGWPHFAVAGSGILIFVLLIFAGKSALQNEDVQPQRNGQEKAQPDSEAGEDQGVDLFGLIPPVKEEGKIAQLVDSLKGMDAQSPQREALMKSLVIALRDEGRVDAASVYAHQLALRYPSLPNLVAAGALLRNAARMEPVANDTIAFARWMNLAVDDLSRAVNMDSLNEDACLELGLALKQTPGTGMQGIQVLKKVVDRNPEHQEANFELGLASMQTGQWERAEGRFRAIKPGFARYLQARLLLAGALKEQGKSGLAAPILKELASQKENSEIARQAQQLLQQH